MDRVSIIESCVKNNSKICCLIDCCRWTYESHDFQKYPFIDDELWTKCMKNLYFRGLTKSHLPLVGTAISTNGSVSPDAKSGICDNASNSFNVNDKNAKKFQIFFGTDFSRGYGHKRFSFGKVN